MTLDVTIEATGAQAAHPVVHLPPEVTEVIYTTLDGVTERVVADRSGLSRCLRQAGYTVVWDDPNPAVALASRMSGARVQTARVNGALSPGRPRSVAKLCPEPLRTSLAYLDKGELMDIVFFAAGGTSEGMHAMRSALTARAALADDEREATP